jgi:hypothetical protein
MNRLLAYTGVLGGRVKEAAPYSGNYVRIEQNVYRSVVFLGHPLTNNERDIDPVGTGFLLSWSKGEGYQRDHQTFIVTAAHVADEFRDGPLAVRLEDKKTGKARVHREEVVWQWVTHEDTTVDVAVTPFELPKWARNEPLSDKDFVTEDVRLSRNIGEGDAAYVIGLYTFVAGKEKNLPFVHTGNVACMVDDERIPWTHWRDKSCEVEIEGHVISAHTIRGASGSPVFVRATMVDDTTSPPTLGPGKSTWLLGVWKGMYTGDEEGKQTLPRMGVAVPATKVLEIMTQSGVEAIMAKKAKKRVAKLAAVTEDQSANNSDKRGDAILKRMLNTPPKPKGIK